MRDILGQALFPLEYKSDRRKHAHRCRACWRIVADGEQVLMSRMRNETYIVHDACKNNRHTEVSTWLDVLTTWAVDRQLGFGYSEKQIATRHPEEFAVFLRMYNRSA